MPERPPFELSNMQDVFEREQRLGRPLPPPPPHPNATVPLIDEARVWLSSEFVDPSEYFRFDSPVAVYEAAKWPLGVRPGRNAAEQVAMLDMCDGYFDHDVRCALALPRRYTGLAFRPPPRRNMANLWIRDVGRWDGEPDRLAEIIAGLARLPQAARYPGYKYHAVYALTPFSIIGQTWCERSASEPAYVVDTTIAFFYTFETLIQECFITDATRAGASTADILAGYEHRHAYVKGQPNLLLRDPTKLKLARYANPLIDWDSIGATPENSGGGSVLPGWQARSRRTFLFESRLQTHLMVAIATACQGLANFASGRVRSALVRTTDVPPGAEALATHWLWHMTGAYDHAAECAELLQSLARHYEQDLSSEQLRGIPIPPFQSPSSEPDLWLIPAARPYLDDAYDAYRLNLFDVSLDDASVIRWGREAHDWIQRSDGKDPPGSRRDSGA
jgi:hypothetical protein